MRLVEGSVSLRVPLLLLGLWVVLAPVQSSQDHPSWRYISSEVVIPREELHLGKGVRIPGWLSYSLSFGGQRHVIHMRRKKLFWPRDLVIMTQDDQGALQMDYPFVPVDCYYLGYLEDVPLSMVTVDTCYGGLDGIMKLDDLAYEIKPLKDSHRFEHIVSQIVADTNAIGPMFPLGHKEERHPLSSQVNFSLVSRVSSKLYASHRGKIRGCLMIAHSLFTAQSNVTRCVEFLIKLGSIMNSLFRGLDTTYYVSVLIVYNKGEPANMRDYKVPGGGFAENYKRMIYEPLRPFTGLIVNRDAPNDVQAASVPYSFCESKALIFMALLGRHVLLIGVIATQKTARTMGIKYDTEYCICQRRTTCIMSRYPGLTDAFSNCSYVDIQSLLMLNELDCLFHVESVWFNRSLTEERCGNYVVDNNEQCDCGSFKQCYSNECCNNDCTLTSGSVCNSGRCCANCTNAPAGWLCRSMQNICDLPEYCPGSRPTCPEDVYLQDGTPCSEDGYCYHGNCTDLNMHCKEIFGTSARNGPDACYSINTKGHRFGHCKLSRTMYIQGCKDPDVKCGRLQCVNVTHLPRLQDHVGFHQSLISGTLCFGVGTHRGTGATDVGAVKTGAPCGGGKFCIEGLCSGIVASIKYNCTPSRCNFRGVCNSKNRCHCHVGWDPPYCIAIGPGGSMDSGPPPRRRRSVRPSDMSIIYLRVVFGRLYALLASVLFGMATNVKTIKTSEVEGVKREEEVPEVPEEDEA